MVKFELNIWSLGNYNPSNLEEKEYDGETYFEGYYLTKGKFCRIYSQQFPRKSDEWYVNIDVFTEDECASYRAKNQKKPTVRGLKILATKCAQEVIDIVES